MDMGVAAIGGGAAMTGCLGAAAPTAGGLNGPLGDANAAALSAMSGTRLGQLTELMEGFSTAEIVLALMLAAAAGKKNRHDDDGGALAILAGLAIAGRIGQTAGCGAGALPGFDAGGVCGVQLNALA